MRLTLLDAEDQALYCQSPARADFSEIFAVAMLSTFSTVSAKLGSRTYKSRQRKSAARTDDDARTRLQRWAAPETIQLIGLGFWLGSAFLHTTSPTGSRSK